MSIVNEYIKVKGNSDAKEILDDYMEYLRKQRYFVMRQRTKN